MEIFLILELLVLLSLVSFICFYHILICLQCGFMSNCELLFKSSLLYRSFTSSLYMLFCYFKFGIIFRFSYGNSIHSFMIHFLPIVMHDEQFFFVVLEMKNKRGSHAYKLCPIIFIYSSLQQ